MILDEQTVPIFISMIDGAAGAGEILNDYLEERGQRRIIDEDFDSLSKPERLPRVLDRYLPGNVGKLIACDFAEHAFEESTIDKKRKKDGTKVLYSCRRFFTDEEPSWQQEQELKEKVQALLHLGREEKPENVKAVWSVWATFMGRPSNVVHAAREVVVGEDVWQLDHAIKTIPSFLSSGN